MSATLRNRRNHITQEETSARVVEVDTDEEVEITRTTEQQRERNRAEKEKKNSAKKHARYDEDGDDDDDKFYISLSDVLRIVLTLIALSVSLSYYVTSGESYIWGFERQRPWWMRSNDIKQFLKGPVNLTPSQLALYDGSDPSLPIYLAINGTIIDVSANPGIYGPGGGYHFFVGRDATRAFVTGCFQEDLTNDMTGVEEMYIPVEDDNDSHREMTLTFTEKNLRRERERREAREKVDAQVKHWLRFYAGHEKYFVVGKVVPEETTGAADGEQQGEGKKRRVLCEGAQRNRPLRSELNKKL